MPIVIKTRTYDDAFYKAMQGDAAAPDTFEEMQQQMNDLF